MLPKDFTVHPVARFARRERGLSLVGLLFVGLIGICLALLGAKLVPAFTEYMSIERAIGSINKDGATVAQIRRDFENFAIVNDITSISKNDLDITKEDDQVVISYAYSYPIQLMDRVRLVIDFSGSTRKRRKAAQ
jgi:HSP20 family molecular chaperone IbpA